MNCHILRVVLFAISGFSLPASIEAAVSAPTNGIYLAVGGLRKADWATGPVTNEVIKFNDTLMYIAFCPTGRVNLNVPLDRAYGVKIKMVGPDGREVSKTSLGQQYGSKWNNLHTFKDTRVGIIAAEEVYANNPWLGGGKLLATPQELFEIGKPGIYTLELEMQMFRIIRNNTTNWPRERFQFPPVKIKVEKPADK